MHTHNRRLSAMGASDSMEDNNFLTVPQTVTASSSAETLTGMYLYRCISSVQCV